MNAPKLFSLFLLAFVALCFPIPGLFGDSSVVMGVPSLYIYLFLFWGAFIGAMWIFAKRSSSDKP